MLRIEKLEHNDKKEFLCVLKNIFPKKFNQQVSFVEDAVDFMGFSPYDIKILYKNKIIGFHLFYNVCMNNYMKSEDNMILNFDICDYKNKKGLMGFVFGISKYYRKRGYASYLIEYEKKFFKNKFDYIWGISYDCFDNIDFWKKTRNVVAVCNEKNIYGNKYITIMDI